MTEIRIGVFICHCGRNIGAYIDVPEVVEYVKQLPDVVHAEHNLYTCSEEGISAIKKGISEYNLNRVIVASCTPITHEPLFRSVCEEAGLNKYLFEMVNIRDQCSWIHMDRPKEATEKAKSLVRAGVARSRLLEPLEESEVEVTPSCLVIGGGIAGMSATLNLANQDFDVYLVEKGEQLGGTLLNLNKLFPTNKDAIELITPIVNAVNAHDRIKVYLETQVEEIAGFIGNFEVTLDHENEESKVEVGTIIVAIGAEEFKPTGLYGYGEIDGVITQLELEKQMKEVAVDGQKIVMINCVGARVPERAYCGKFCCLTAMKNATLIKQNNPEAKVWVLDRDVMTYGIEFEDYYRKAMEAGVRFIKYSLDRPPEIVGNGRVEGVKVYHQLMQKEIMLPSDMVVLTTPLIPRDSNDKLSKILKVPLGQDGFFLEAHLKLQPVEFATDGIYICGSARWPVDISDAVFQGFAAASKAAIPLRRGYVKAEAITASVNEERCAGCGVCVGLCPYGSIELKTENDRTVAHVISALCKGCGTCGAACPSGAMTMNHFKKNQIFAQIEALLA